MGVGRGDVRLHKDTALGALTAAQRQVADDVLQSLAQELGASLVGVLFFGSLASGRPVLHSDLDLIAVTDDDWSQSRSFYLRGVLVDLHVRPDFHIDQRLRDRELVMTDMMAGGVALHDPRGYLADRIAWAQRIMREGPELDPYAMDASRHMLANMVDDVEDIYDEDRDNAQLQAASALLVSIRRYLQSQKVWPPKDKYALRALSEVSPELGRRVREVVRAGAGFTTPEFRAVVEDLLEPVGGLLLIRTDERIVMQRPR